MTPAVPRRPVAILNPVARDHDRVLCLLREHARRAGWPELGLLPTTEHDFGGGQADQALAMGADLVVVGGGDGTVRAVAERVRGTGVAMAVVPMGTANIFARNLGLSRRRLERAVMVAIAGPERDVDLGVAVFRTAALPTQDSREHLFLVLAGLGNDARTVARTRPGLKRRLGWLAYFESGARHLLAAPLPLRVALDARPARTTTAWSFLVGNARSIPLGIQVFPGARLDDGLLRTLEARVVRVRDWLPVAVGAVVPGRRSSVLVRDVCRRVVVQPQAPTQLQLDGDVFGPVVELRIHVEARALRLRVPQGFADAHPAAVPAWDIPHANEALDPNKRDEETA